MDGPRDDGQQPTLAGRGGERPHRDRDLIGRLVAIVAACAQWGPLLFVSDGLSTYIDVVRKAFRTRQTGTRGRPRLIPWPELVIAQVVKQYAGRAVTGTIHRLVHGLVPTFLTLLWSTPGCQVLNTAYIERLNGTFRSCLAALGRRTRRAARRDHCPWHVLDWDALQFLHGAYESPHDRSWAADAGDGGGDYRPCLDGGRTPALSGAAPTVGTPTGPGSAIQGRSGPD